MIGKRLDGKAQGAYFDGDVNLITDNDVPWPGASTSENKTTADLQSPTAYTGIYSVWDVVESGAADIDGTADFWHFGANDDYPALKGPTGDGLTWKDFGYQLREGPILSPPDCESTSFEPDRCAIFGDAPLTLQWSAVDTSFWDLRPAGNHLRGVPGWGVPGHCCRNAVRR